jgi:Zn finger protein HypA/HybF involved in hydrogenase expression
MSEIAGQTGLRGAAAAVVHESYSFACMRCGHGWEQSYEIEHHTDAENHEFVMYVANGQVVPSPLSRPACQNCDGQVVRIMRAGQVSSVHSAAQQSSRRPVQGGRDEVAEEAEEAETGPAAATEASAQVKAHDHWHLSDLLHPFQRKAS